MEAYLDHNSRFLLVKEGRKLFTAVCLTHGHVTTETFQKQESRHWRPAMLKGKPYPIDRAKRKLRGIGRRLGMTKQAAALLTS